MNEPDANGPLSSEDLLVLDRVFTRRKSIARAVTLARANAIAALASAALCVPFAFFDPGLLWVALVLAVIGSVELRGGRMLRDFDARAPKWLALNQLALFLALAVYCGFGIYAGTRGSAHAPADSAGYDELSSQLGELADGLGSDAGQGLLDHAYKGAVIGAYLALLVACGLYQGACAWFYLTRARLIAQHQRESPAWALALERRLLGW